MQNDEIRNQYEAFARIDTFGKKYAVDFPATSRGGREFAKIAAVVAEMEANGVKQLAGSGVFHGGTGNKALSAEAAMALLRQIRKTAVAIAEAEDMPEFDDKFMIPRSNAYEGVLASAHLPQRGDASLGAVHRLRAASGFPNQAPADHRPHGRGRDG